MTWMNRTEQSTKLFFQFELPELVTHQPNQFKSSYGQADYHMTRTEPIRTLVLTQNTKCFVGSGMFEIHHDYA